MDKVCYVVGDKYQNLCSIHSSEIITYSQLMEKLCATNDCCGTTYVVGQGLCEERIATLRSVGVCFVNDSDLVPVTPRVVHKHHLHNTLITSPVRHESDRFIARLRVDDRCAELSDHVTGIHISGNLLVEALRQMTIACIELYCINPEYRYRSRFVWNDLSIRFKKFIFPKEVFIVAILKSQKNELKDRWRGSFDIACIQNGEVGCEATVGMSTYPSEWLEFIEYSNAFKVFRNALVDVPSAA